MGKGFRKPPTMPKWWWVSNDGCWWCKYNINQKGCSNCTTLKRCRRKEMNLKKIKGGYIYKNEK